jgi:hypothetical protein
MKMYLRPVGWRRESYRHYLARKGVKTKMYIGKVRGIPMSAEHLPVGAVYPISPLEVKKRIEQMPAKDTKGIAGVEFVNPKGEQKNAYAQYVRSKRVVKIFSQPFADGKVDGESPRAVNDHMKEYVLPHEVGHHKALSQHGITDKHIEVAEARADANVLGMEPTDRAVKLLVQR